MFYVVVEELIPEAHREGNVDLATVSLMLGFVVMMVSMWPWGDPASIPHRHRPSPQYRLF